MYLGIHTSQMSLVKCCSVVVTACNPMNYTVHTAQNTEGKMLLSRSSTPGRTQAALNKCSINNSFVQETLWKWKNCFIAVPTQNANRGFIKSPLIVITWVALMLWSGVKKRGDKDLFPWFSVCCVPNAWKYGVGAGVWLSMMYVMLKFHWTYQSIVLLQLHYLNLSWLAGDRLV